MRSACASARRLASIGAVPFLAVALVAGCLSRPPAVVELPTVWSDPPASEAPEGRASGIYNLVRSGKMPDWLDTSEGKTRGMCVHITADDEIEIYRTASLWPRRGKVNAEQFRRAVGQIPVYSSARVVLITSEHDPRTSTALTQVLEVLPEMYARIFYLSRS